MVMNIIVLQVSWHNIETQLGGEKISSLLWCIGIIAATQLLKKPLAKIVTKLIAKITNRFTDKKHSAVFQGLIVKPIESLIQVILFYVALSQLTVLLNSLLMHRIRNKHEEFAIRLGDIVDHIFLFLVILFTTLALSRIIDFIYHIQLQKAQEERNKGRQQLLPLLKDVVKVVLWTIGAFWVLGSVFHVNVPALVTGLGIGGVAIALAAKESVENLFAAFTILTDKPFQVDDSIKLGAIEGTVERIGFRSTRLRGPDGTSLIIPNKKLVYENLENLTDRAKRRMRMVVNIKYGIPYPALQQLTKDLREMLQHTLYVTDPIEISLEGFAENVFQLAVTYFLPEPLPKDTPLASIKQEVNMRIYDIVSRYAGDNVSVTETKQPEEPNDEEREADKKEDSII
jgi:MscS family membrane protein